MSKFEKNDKVDKNEPNSSDPTKLQLMHDMECEMMSDLYARMTSVCHKKCIAPRYREGELGKGEMLCLDRCVAKYLEIHGRIGKMLSNMTMQEDELHNKKNKNK